ncbi:MFS transporter [Marinicella rhabdoformis]|uniref:MFS transporter n=1 Tax=Marinicella rhabdoformis TaxID=2580566 RepID=UPI0012AEBB6F|nr:MFS transporter [Marinicella rhabdoformis]
MQNLIIIVSGLLLCTALIDRFSGLPRNITLLFIAQPLVMAAAPLLVFIGGIISSQMAPDPSLVTLPLGLMVAGVASATIPAALLAKRWGRRKAVMFGFSGSVLGHLLAAFAVMLGHFWLFCLAGFLLGNAGAFGQQLRFAAMESLDSPKLIPRAISVLMFTGIFAALIGPEVGLLSSGWIDSHDGGASYAGAFVALAGLSFVAILIVSFFKDPLMSTDPIEQKVRPLSTIIMQPVFIIAMMAAALGFGLMSFIMTATPLSMHSLHGHSLEHTKWVIQSHVSAMYLPSLLTIWLGQKIPIKYFLMVGTLMFVAVLVIAGQGHELVHYWWALIVLGVGWNFLFFSGTTLLPRSYHEAEKHKVQAINDFSVFAFQGASSLLAGWVVFQFGWDGILMASMPFVAVMVLLSLASLFVLRK